MKIVSVVGEWVRIPMPQPVGFSIKTLAHRDYLIVRVRSDAGVEGVGVTLNDASAAPGLAAVKDLLGPMLLGQDPRDITHIWERLYWQTVRAGRRGNLVFALSAVDIALWDHYGKLTEQPLYKLLGGYRKSVSCYASGGYYYDGTEGLDRLAREVESYMEQGFRAVKMKVARLSIKEELERIRLVRSIIGPDTELFLDANQAWHDVNDAMAFIKRCEPYNIGWIEEPFPPDFFDHYRRLKARSPIPIATGEVGATRWEFHQLLDGIDISQHDATVCGGISEWLKITDLCAARGVTVAPHYFWDIHVHLAAARREVRWVEFFVGTNVVNLDLVLQEPLTAHQGTLTPPERPGLGMAFDEAAIQRHLYERAEIKL